MEEYPSVKLLAEMIAELKEGHYRYYLEIEGEEE